MGLLATRGHSHALLRGRGGPLPPRASVGHDVPRRLPRVCTCQRPRRAASAPRRAQDLDVSVDLLRAMLDGKADVSTAQDVLKALCNTCARRRGLQ